MQLFIIFSLILLFQYNFKNLLFFLVGFLLLVFPLLYIILIKIQSNYCEIQQSIFDQIVIIRHFRHYLPKYFPILSITKYLLIWIIGFIILHFYSKSSNKNTFKRFYIFQILGVATYSIITLYFPKLSVIQFFKTTVWIVPFSSLLMADFMVSKLSLFKNIN